jgi:HAD superfamily hydrolase (TIGR01549 family)
MMEIKWLLFDFGGCLDSDGVHSRSLFMDQFIKHDLILVNDDSKAFQEAYTYSDRHLSDESLMLNSTLLEMNEQMCLSIAKELNTQLSSQVSEVAKAITQIQSYYLKRNKRVLELLAPNYKLGIISNFSGNLRKILDEFSLTSYFNFIIDSHHVGVSKPNPAIFNLAIQKCNTTSSNICFIGDNIERDIAPANMLGMKTVLISPLLQTSSADYTLSSVEKLLVLTQKT